MLASSTYARPMLVITGCATLTRLAALGTPARQGWVGEGAHEAELPIAA
jgi:hypothetical protein